MALWGSKDDANNAPKYAVAGGLGVSANGETLYQNVTASAYVDKEAVGVFGVDTTEQNVAANPKGGHAGWVLRTAGTGPITSITANTGAYSPDGNIYLTFSGGGAGATAANAQIVTNGSKQILSITVRNPGNYLTTPTATATNANAVFTITMGGRANRVQTETMVAMGSMGADGSSGNDDAIFADS